MTVMLPTLSPALLYGLLFVLVSLGAAFSASHTRMASKDNYGNPIMQPTPLSIWLGFASALSGLLAFLCIGGAALEALRISFHP